MVNQQQKGNGFEGSDEGILTEIIWKGKQQIMTPIRVSLIMKLNIQLLQKICKLNT
jgi:hypothetical protein